MFFLQTNGSGVLSFNTPSAGSFVYLGETSASNVASVDLNGYFTSTYDYYQIFFDDCYGSTNGAVMKIQFSTTGSYTVQTSGYYSVVATGNNSVSGAVVNPEGVFNVASASITSNKLLCFYYYLRV